ncbi:MAG: MarR family winged helix-turn-helix transcriptional regulator [Mycoplasmatales bacterium]
MLVQKIRQLNNELETYLKIRLGEFDLSIGQWEVLMAIYKSTDNAISATKLEKRLQLDKRLLSLTLTKLERNGYIERVSLNIDKRKKYIELTIEALEIAEDLRAIEVELNDVMIEQLNNNLSFEENLTLLSARLQE